MDDQWCPLFGALPSCDEWDGITEKCLGIIEDARCFWGGLEYPSGLDNTGYSASWIRSARLLTMGCATNDILFSAQHMQGICGRGTGWIKGKDGEPFLLCDVDQLASWSIMGVIRQRAGIEHDFCCALVETDDDCYFKDDGEPAITPAMIYALMAIGSAWHLMNDIARGDVKAKSQEASLELLQAEKLLKAANAAALHQNTARETWRDAKEIEDKRKGGITRQAQIKDGVNIRHLKWQRLADEIWAKHPDWKIIKVAIEIAKLLIGDKEWQQMKRDINAKHPDWKVQDVNIETAKQLGQNVNWIRKNIQKKDLK
jgi:hypothetical protein